MRSSVRSSGYSRFREGRRRLLRPRFEVTAGARTSRLGPRRPTFMEEMSRRLAIALTSFIVAAGAARSAAALQTAPGQSRAQAEVHLLRIVARNWGASGVAGLVDPRTHMLANNTQAICLGRGKRLPRARYTRFTCVVRASGRAPVRELRISFRALAGGRCECHRIAPRRR
jgi:hypothetical protein